MKTQGYTAAELAGFYAVLDRAVCEAAERDLQISIPTMVQRLFEAADRGERDPMKLASIIIGRPDHALQTEAA
ncbi:hypothetical protein [Hyphomicrobium facile]|uniref:Uncharacterized protein n=1 Tax=Hyphomicrobium facile TaxID=51670 RepID=A0A1I7MUJ4_9HYPH|nr:hypothetical protein [Hyphomicrobium facile]SFV26074.1 hypothetical protein SAMN04488557_0314 [Hyphomicrobium facile]